MKRVLIIHVPARLPGTAWHYRGSFLKRAGEDLVPMDAAELSRLFSEAGPDYSAEPTNASMADLSPEAIAEFRRRWMRKTGNLRLEWQVPGGLHRHPPLSDLGAHR